jgi:hypothetical protein
MLNVEDPLNPDSKTWTYLMREEADEHHTSVYLQVILKNKVHLGALPQPFFFIRDTHLWNIHRR